MKRQRFTFTVGTKVPPYKVLTFLYHFVFLCNLLFILYCYISPLLCAFQGVSSFTFCFYSLISKLVWTVSPKRSCFFSPFKCLPSLCVFVLVCFFSYIRTAWRQHHSATVFVQRAEDTPHFTKNQEKQRLRFSCCPWKTRTCVCLLRCAYKLHWNFAN